MSKIIAFAHIDCSKCNQIFFSNNKLHQHVCRAHSLKIIKSNDDFISNVMLIKLNLKIFFNSNKSSFTTIVTKNFSFEKFFTSMSVINSNVDFNKNVKIDYDFRDWNYDKINVILFVNVEAESICLNFDLNIILIDRTFFWRQIFDVSI